MAGYQRKTALGPREILEKAAEHLPEFIGLQCSRKSSQGATYTGQEGTVTIQAHRHGPFTDVTAQTDRLRTSRMDYEIQRFLNMLPYEHGDAGGPGSGDPA
ncbi:MAG: hypothetical protein F4187_04775 [Gemmatimonadetes bacterium]|nr:hypothetical protein [Gemmatimonadota bacterium]MYI07480.1 hypothetical protein [Gemmatimonadota bacterium]